MVRERWGEKPSEIAQRLGRDKNTITRLLIKRRPRNAQGRKRLLTAAAVDKLEKKLEELIFDGGWAPQCHGGNAEALIEVLGLRAQDF